MGTPGPACPARPAAGDPVPALRRARGGLGRGGRIRALAGLRGLHGLRIEHGVEHGVSHAERRVEGHHRHPPSDAGAGELSVKRRGPAADRTGASRDVEHAGHGARPGAAQGQGVALDAVGLGEQIGERRKGFGRHGLTVRRDAGMGKATRRTRRVQIAVDSAGDCQGAAIKRTAANQWLHHCAVMAAVVGPPL